jgi:hypothetical protein
VRERWENIRKNGRGRSALCRVVSVLEAIPQLSGSVTGSPLVPNSINGGEFVHLNLGHKVLGAAILSCNLLDFLVEERSLGTANRHTGPLMDAPRSTRPTMKHWSAAKATFPTGGQKRLVIGCAVKS